MKNCRIPSVLIVTAVLAAVVVACDNSPTRPSSPDGSMSNLELTGPATVAPGEVARYTLTTPMPGGRRRDLTDGAVWQSSAPSVMSFDKGVGTGLGLGESLISAVFKGRTTTKSVVVTPTGTFRLSGTVLQANSKNAVAGAKVEAYAPSGDVQKTATGINGGFVLYGVDPAAELRISHPLYDEHRQSLALTDHGVVNVPLAPNASSPPINGRYTLTIGSPECPGEGRTIPGLPGYMRQRTYTAQVALRSDGRSIDVTLEGANFAPRLAGSANRFSGTEQAGRLKFNLWGPDDYYYYYYAVHGPDVVERMDDGTYLIYSGAATMDFTWSGFQGQLNGSMRNAATPDKGGLIARCSGSFPMTFTR